MKTMFIVMLAVGAMAVSQDNVPKIEDQVFAVVNSYVREPSMRYGYRAAPSAGAYPYFYPRAYPYAAAYPYPQDYPAYHLAPSVDQYTMGNPYTNSYEFAYKRPTKNYAYTPYAPSAYAPAAYPYAFKFNPFAALADKNQ